MRLSWILGVEMARLRFYDFLSSLLLIYLIDLSISLLNMDASFLFLQLGSRLIELLIESAFVQSPPNQLVDGLPDIRPAFRHSFKAVAKEDGYESDFFFLILG